MSVYNSENHIKSAIESILNQSYSHFEFLIINDGSTDDSEKIIKSYQDNRIVFINNEKNLGLTKSLNIGIKKAKGKYIARMDADDISLPQRIKKQLDFLQNNQDYTAIGSSVERIDDNSKHIENWLLKSPPEKIFYLLHFRNCLIHSSMMYKREDVIKVGLYNEKIKFAQDYDLWIKLSNFSKIAILDEVLLKFRKTSHGISVKKEKQQAEYVQQIVSENIKNLTGKNFPNIIIKFLGDSVSLKANFSKREKKNSIKILKNINKNIFKNCFSFYNKKELIKIIIYREKYYKKLLFKKFNFLNKIKSIIRKIIKRD